MNTVTEQAELPFLQKSTQQCVLKQIGMRTCFDIGHFCLECNGIVHSGLWVPANGHYYSSDNKRDPHCYPIHSFLFFQKIHT